MTEIEVKYNSLKDLNLVFGPPVTDETATPDGRGRYRHYQSGTIYWTRKTGAHEVHGAIRDKWASMGWERGQLGYPTSDEMEDKKSGSIGGRYSEFENGTISWTPAGGAKVKITRVLIDDN